MSQVPLAKVPVEPESTWLSKRLALSRKRLGMSQRRLAAAMGSGYDQPMISHVESGRNGLVGRGLCKAAAALGVSIDYLLGLTNHPKPVDEIFKDVYVYDVYRKDVAWIPQIAAVVGLGKKRDIYDTTVVGLRPFPYQKLLEREINPEHCHFVTVQGDLMEPLLPDGCTILVDTSRREFQNDHIYVMHYEQQVMETFAKVIAPARLKLVNGEFDGKPYSDWYFTNFKDGSLGFPLAVFDLKAVLGEVMWVETFL